MSISLRDFPSLIISCLIFNQITMDDLTQKKILKYEMPELTALSLGTEAFARGTTGDGQDEDWDELAE